MYEPNVLYQPRKTFNFVNGGWRYSGGLSLLRYPDTFTLKVKLNDRDTSGDWDELATLSVNGTCEEGCFLENTETAYLTEQLEKLGLVEDTGKLVQCVRVMRLTEKVQDYLTTDPVTDQLARMLFGN